ncbi:MAG: NUDIX domain-containing protein [Opitutaceae bacterium]|jgi:isopentenyldiphosphate isomerase|nr:NUDIX domain-containing protein [Opitutaceae bacterium]
MRQPDRAQSPDEIFDVVDADDRVVGRATRAEVHARGLRHRAVHAWVFNAAGLLLLQKRSLQKDTAPGRWDSSCSGHLDAGEDYDAAVLRELGEEIGFAPPRPPRLLFKVAACPGTANEFTRVYRLEAEGPFRANPAEIAALRWHAPDDISRRLREEPEAFSKTFAHLWRLAAGAGGAEGRDGGREAEV